MPIVSWDAYLKLARLPIPPHPRGDSSDGTQENQRRLGFRNPVKPSVLDDPRTRLVRSHNALMASSRDLSVTLAYRRVVSMLA